MVSSERFIDLGSRRVPPARLQSAVAPLRMRAVLSRAASSVHSRPPRRAPRVCAAARGCVMASLSAADAKRAVDLFTLCENLKARHAAHAVCSAARVGARREEPASLAVVFRSCAARRSAPLLARATRVATHTRRIIPSRGARAAHRRLKARCAALTQPRYTAHAAHGLGARRRAQAGVHRRPHVPHGAPPASFLPCRTLCALISRLCR